MVNKEVVGKDTIVSEVVVSAHAFCRMKSFMFVFKCHWSLFSRVQFTNSIILFMLWLGAVRQQAITWTNVGPDPQRRMITMYLHMQSGSVLISSSSDICALPDGYFRAVAGDVLGRSVWAVEKNTKTLTQLYMESWNKFKNYKLKSEQSDHHFALQTTFSKNIYLKKIVCGIIQIFLRFHVMTSS